ncbi:hypothetical protein B0T26DRAFT_863977 [Lasiosphaeria miniovina]|uniref:F-box domain-containing protein n=1 Tax=Lasiosphaeria miniovina TaxID=1954250 RepID=A0AA39ZT71_9PEZI|nr:uncharacterized protein B0T26DRAFT_863977 [Lasiosphaeria miniovina]KAK0703140.1 hypothetical protein B0T26DRAFT_863977 [Lasiosphaeria miniovina]
MRRYAFPMVQTFQLVAPRAKKMSADRANLGEMLFNGSARGLVRLLAVPVRPQNPPETASSTLAQAQNSRLTATAAQMASHGAAKDMGGTDGHFVIDRPVSFSTLPPEVCRLIFACIQRIDDVICLGLANRYFWSMGRERMHDYYMSFLGELANENIVCVGEDVKPGDYPPGLFSAQELDVLGQREGGIPDDWDSDWDDEAYLKVPFTLYHFTFLSISTMVEDVCLFNKSLALLGHFSLLGISKDPAFNCTCLEMRVEEATYFPQDQQWILRNLTTKQLVRSEAIVLKPEFIHGPNISVLGFGEVVMSRIRWSTSSYTNMSATVDVSRGVWAGHRFDITTLARHQDEINEVGWSDVSDEVAREIAVIWESEYGADWRETVCEDWYTKFGRSLRPVS